MPCRQRGPTPGPPAAREMAGLAQVAVGGGHGGTADAQDLGQLAFGGQPDGQSESTVPEQATDRAGQGRVLRQTRAPWAADGAPLIEQAEQLAAADCISQSQSPRIGSFSPSNWPPEWQAWQFLARPPCGHSPSGSGPSAGSPGSYSGSSPMRRAWR